jgi:hypothetical protein
MRDQANPSSLRIQGVASTACVASHRLDPEIVRSEGQVRITGLATTGFSALDPVLGAGPWSR